MACSEKRARTPRLSDASRAAFGDIASIVARSPDWLQSELCEAMLVLAIGLIEDASGISILKENDTLPV